MKKLNFILFNIFFVFGAFSSDLSKKRTTAKFLKTKILLGFSFFTYIFYFLNKKYKFINLENYIKFLEEKLIILKNKNKDQNFLTKENFDEAFSKLDSSIRELIENIKIEDKIKNLIVKNENLKINQNEVAEAVSSNLKYSFDFLNSKFDLLSSKIDELKANKNSENKENECLSDKFNTLSENVFEVKDKIVDFVGKGFADLKEFLKDEKSNE